MTTRRRRSKSGKVTVWKAVAAGVGAGLGALATGATDGHITMAEELVALSATVGAAFATYQLPYRRK